MRTVHCGHLPRRPGRGPGSALDHATNSPPGPPAPRVEWRQFPGRAAGGAPGRTHAQPHGPTCKRPRGTKAAPSGERSPPGERWHAPNRPRPADPPAQPLWNHRSQQCQARGTEAPARVRTPQGEAPPNQPVPVPQGARGPSRSPQPGGLTPHTADSSGTRAIRTRVRVRNVHTCQADPPLG